MELRVLRYFLEVAREGNITHAAQRLHVSQPTLSRQLKELERELGKKLFTRSDHSIRLTDEGMLLRRRAEDIVSMVEKTEREFQALDELDGGGVNIGCAESEGLLGLFDVMREFRQRHPRVRFHLHSGATEPIVERLDRGILDFAVIVQQADLAKYNSLNLPARNRWGVIMRSDDPLARKTAFRREDLLDLPVICSRQGLEEETLGWLGELRDRLDVVATYDPLYNASLLVRAGFGYALGFEGIVRTDDGGGLCFRPLDPPLSSPLHFIWKRHQAFSPAARALLDRVGQVAQSDGVRQGTVERDAR